MLDRFRIGHSVAGRLARRELSARAILKFLGRIKREDVERLQLRKLRRLLAHVYSRSKFYKKLLDAAGLKPSDVRKLDDLRKIPFTTPEELSRDPRSFICVPPDHITHVFTTAGTTGRPKKVFFSKEEIDREVRWLSYSLTLAGVTKSDVVQVMFAYGRPCWSAGYLMQRTVEELGALAIPAGNTLSPEEQVELIREYETTVISGTASYVHRITKEGESLCDLSELSVREILLAAEPWPESLRKYLEDAWSAEVYDCYGLTEIGLVAGGECSFKSGLHVNELSLIVEVVDPKTGEVLGEEEEGELVFTTLDRECMPFVRYRSRDLSLVLSGACECSIPFKRIARIRGRIDDMVTLGTGENAFPALFDSALLGIPELVDYRIVIDKNGYRDKLTIEAEVKVRNKEVERKILEAVLEIPSIRHDVFYTKTIAMPEVVLLQPGELGSSDVKAKKILDRRDLYPS